MGECFFKSEWRFTFSQSTMRPPIKDTSGFCRSLAVTQRDSEHLWRGLKMEEWEDSQQDLKPLMLPNVLKTIDMNLDVCICCMLGWCLTNINLGNSSLPDTGNVGFYAYLYRVYINLVKTVCRLFTVQIRPMRALYGSSSTRAVLLNSVKKK